jgi:hypothetical protein
VETVQTIDEGHPDAVRPQYAGNAQQSHWLGPEVVGGKVMNPGVDQQNMGHILGHVIAVLTENVSAAAFGIDKNFNPIYLHFRMSLHRLSYFEKDCSIQNL